MIAEAGHLAIAIALAFSVLLAVYPLWGAAKGNGGMMSLARPFAYGQFFFTAIAFALLVAGFVTNDFSIAYVAANSNSQLPVVYRVTAVWGSHEGSFLLWMLMQAGWIAAVAIFSRSMPLPMIARVLAILGLISIGFYLFMITVSNPFDRSLPLIPVDGRDLNPLLQDPGMIIHPPLLYMGYVGFSVAFAFAIAALLSGKLDAAWARWSRPWTLAAWIFLTLGIAIGSWWAYYELGWGGWWFWDPVENASFMPWLVGTALLHSLAVTEKRGSFKSWTVLLAISAFSLSLLGTFLVRSGVLVSVHAFASDPTRGLFILVLLGLVVGGSLILYGLRAGKMQSYSRYELLSREVMLLGNNVLLMAAMVVVFLGTMLPLVHKEIGLGTISIGEPFFNELYSWLVIPFALMLGLGPLMRWRRQAMKPLLKPLALALSIAIVLAYALPKIWAGELPAMVVIALFLAFWVALATLTEVQQTVKQRKQGLSGLTKISGSHWGMVLGHLGFAVTLIGISLVSHYEQERDIAIAPGQSANVMDYQVVFERLEHREGPNYDADEGLFTVYQDGEQITQLTSEKRFYRVQRTSMTEVGLDASLLRDIYIAMGEPLDDETWAIRFYIKPFVRWIWLGAIIMAIGGAMALADKRYRKRSKKEAADD
ncbi:MAG TPA: heme lyase NrfEFG subunit NrfE [Idiomarina abyssalis]|uniref:heme lyase CcmF/NrfE family subunit n=1 Tax=Idiomarina TaxID=135575 RepID=UPI000C6750D9|nr:MULTISPECIES: heme lyase CcmF/NrfE family subunit [Idiomarina]MBH94473.1 heme lyase NrfEFG subunit NrfE [Idiomarina sp.]HAS15265.1 heme lyase NrfEFG subunit NrfE [Idiomarina abyssalis]|tara:strand:+ start:96684 stop:98639 length:1956 start_codon:yes stop_codon:yes gene_type:complete